MQIHMHTIHTHNTPDYPLGAEKVRQKETAMMRKRQRERNRGGDEKESGKVKTSGITLELEAFTASTIHCEIGCSLSIGV